MKTWWYNLAKREQQLVSVGTVAVLLILIYFFAWQPFASSLQQLRENISTDKALLVWMQANLEDYKQSSSQQKHMSDSNQSLLTRIEQSLEQGRMSAYSPELSQLDNNQIKINFQMIAFNDLLKWLVTLSQQTKLDVVQARITSTDEPGMVGAQLSLSSLH